MSDRLTAALSRTSEDLARVIAEGSGSLSIAAIAEERARIRQQMNDQRASAPATTFGG